MSVRILLADDHEIMREGLCALLRKYPEMEIVGQASEGRSAVRLAKELLPDVVIMDIAMPNLNGVDATRRIIAKCPNVKVMALSKHSDRAMVAKMLKAGASAYMLKSSAFTELVNGLNAVINNKTYLCPKTAEVVLADYVNLLTDPQLDADEHLTAREREVLQLVSEGWSTKEIAASLHLSAKTVDSHRGRIMNKLDIHNMAGLTKYAIREGLTNL